MSAYKLLGIKTITEAEFNILVKLKNKVVRTAMLDALAKQEQAYANREALEKALKLSGLM